MIFCSCFTNLAWRRNASLLLYSAFLQLLCDWPLIYVLLQPQCSVICHDRISYMAQNATCWESALDGFQLWWCIMLQQEMKLKSSGKMRVIPLSQTHSVLQRLGRSCCGWRKFVSRSYEKISVWSRVSFDQRTLWGLNHVLCRTMILLLMPNIMYNSSVSSAKYFLLVIWHS